MKKLTVLKTKFEIERQQMLTEMKTNEKQLGEMRAMYEGQMRLIRQVTGHSKNQSALLTEPTHLQQVHEDSAQNERIARQVSRSAFMGLGDNPPKLQCES